MKIGVITYWTSDNNYGQILQAFALQKYLKSKGHDAYLITYIANPPKAYEYIKDFIKCLLYIFLRRSKYEEIFLFYKNKRKNRKRKFKEFKKLHLQKSTKVYHNLYELKQDPPEADIYITGSDQVWNNTACNKENGVWYLDFGKKNIIKSSYAASSGRKFSKEEYPYINNYLSQFKLIGVRENELLNDLNSIGINNSRVVLDPTLLLPQEEYTSLFNNKRHECNKYIFFYILNIRKASEIYWDEINAFRHSKNLECKIVSASGYYQAKEIIKGEKNIQASIPEWLEYIKNAEFIVTTSFHGVVFCIKFQKPFIVIPLKGKYSKGNDRIYSLLKKLELSNRIYSEDISFGSQIEAPIDWNKVNKLLQKEQEESEHFFKDLIS